MAQDESCRSKQFLLRMCFQMDIQQTVQLPCILAGAKLSYPTAEAEGMMGHVEANCKTDGP